MQVVTELMAALRGEVGSHFVARLVNRLAFFMLAGAIGALVGLSTLLLIKLILLVQWLGYAQAAEDQFAFIAAGLPAWRVILVPAAGGLLVGLLLQRLPEKRYHGIADVMEACALNSARMPARSGLVAALAAGISLGVGAPLGREGPAVHIGASLSAWLAERLGLDHKQSLALLGCGAAAAVAASFNAPIAAVIFALEVIVGYYTLRVFAPIVIAALFAMVVRQAFLGTEPLFPVPAYQMSSLWELLSFALLGVTGAMVARLLLLSIGAFKNGFTWLHIPPWLRPALAGVAIGLVAVALPGVLSTGYEATFAAVSGELSSQMLLTLLLAKIGLVALALGSGFAGGVFSPAVFIGATLGGTFWWLLSMTGLPLAEQSVYSIIGVAAVASALLGAPISTILIVFELTRNYEVTLGVMTAAAFSSTVMQLGGHGSFFRWQLAQRNINLSGGRDISLLMTHRVEDLITQRYAEVDTDITAGDLESRLGTERLGLAMFVDEQGVFQGSVNLSSLISHAIANGMDSRALDAAFSTDYVISPMTNIVTAVQVMAEQQVEFIPVTLEESPGVIRLQGAVLKSDLLAEHYDVVKRAREDEFGIT